MLLVLGRKEGERERGKQKEGKGKKDKTERKSHPETSNATHREGKRGSLQESCFREEVQVDMGGTPVKARLGLRQQPGVQRGGTHL